MHFPTKNCLLCSILISIEKIDKSTDGIGTGVSKTVMAQDLLSEIRDTKYKELQFSLLCHCCRGYRWMPPQASIAV
jgi:hypothetical protein